jgi:hypothetical protein
MSTFNLLEMLSQQKGKTDYFQIVQQEINSTLAQLQTLNYKINIKDGLDGVQAFQTTHSLYLFQYFRDLHFMYWGLQGSWPTVDPIDKMYYIGLRGFVENQFNSLP